MLIDTSLNEIISNDLDISALQSFRTTQEAYNSTNTTNISNLQSGQSTNTSAITTINNTLNDHTNTLSNIDTSLNVHNATLGTLTSFQASQITYNSSNTANISALQAKDTQIDTSLNEILAYQATNDINLTTLTNKDTQIDASLNEILIDISTLESAEVTLQNNINNCDNDITTLNASVSTLNIQATLHTSAITDLDTLTTQHTIDISDLDTLTGQHTTSITNLETRADTIESDIIDLETLTSSHTTDLGTKQTTLSSSNRLNASYIADGFVSNAQFQTLYGINTGSSIETRLTSLNNALTSLNIEVDTLEALQNIDLTNFSNIGTQITDLQNKDTQIDTSLNTIITDIATNVGRLNTHTDDITAINGTLTSHTTNINQNTTDIGLLQSDVSTAQADILTKQDIIDTDNKLSASNVSTNVSTTPSSLDVILQSLTDINTSQSTALTSINSSITTLTNEIANNDVEILALQNQDTNHTNAIGDIVADVSQNAYDITLKHNVINGSNKLSTAYVHDTNEDDTLENIIISINSDIATKQDIIDTGNKLSIANVDLTGSNLVYADYGSSINSKFTSLDGQISTLTTLQNGDIVNFTAVDTSLNDLYTKTVNYSYLSNVTSDIQNQIDNVVASSLPSMSYDSPTTTTSIANTTSVQTILFPDASEQTTAFTNAIKTDVSNNVAQVSINLANISQNTADILTKQNIIDTNNKLPISDVDLTGSTLVYADYGSSINTKFTNIDSTLTSQASLNTSVSNSITTLTSGKQDLLDGSNKLNPQFIQCSGAGELTSTKTQYLSSIDVDIATKFSSKADVANQTFTGTITIPDLTVTNSLFTSAITEKVGSSWTSFSSNILTINYTTSPIVYFTGLTSNTNFKLAVTNVPASTNKTLTFTLVITTKSYKAYANTFSLNGTNYTLYANGGLANVDVSTVSTSGLIVQQFTMIYTGSFQKVISNVSPFY